MTNKHIELVKRWLADNNSVSLEELEAARDATHADADAAAAKVSAARAAVRAVTSARDADLAAAGARAAAFWIKKYEELTNLKIKESHISLPPTMAAALNTAGSTAREIKC